MRRRRREPQEPSGYWPAVYARGVQIRTEKGWGGDPAYTEARNQIDAEMKFQMPLDFGEPTALVLT